MEKSWWTGSQGWTGGQFSLYRVLLAIAIFWALSAFTLFHSQPGDLILPMPWKAPWIDFGGLPPAVKGLLGTVFSLATLLVAVGKWVRWSMVILFLGLFWFLPQYPFLGLPGLFIPIAFSMTGKVAPYGSLEAFGRVDPGDAWVFPKNTNLIAFAFLILTLVGEGIYRLFLPDDLYGGWLSKWMETGRFPEWVSALAGSLSPASLKIIGFFWASALILTPLALIPPRTRKGSWLVLFAILTASLIAGPVIFVLPLLLLMVLILAGNPAWLNRVPPEKPEWLFYDGYCGLCHRICRFVLAEDPEAIRFRLAPIGGETFTELIDSETAAGLADSVILRTNDGRIFQKSTATIMILDRLGGIWRVFGWLMRLIPRPIRDFGYEFVARIRYKLFARPAETCPLLPPHLRARFGS